MKAYLKGFYGYKNFGDELLLLGVIKRIFSNYKIQKLTIESGNTERLNHRLQENLSIIQIEQSKIETVSIKQHKYKVITHILNFLGFGKYKKHFKFFGGGEVLNTERKFPGNGRNIPLLYNYSVRKREFVLLGGIGKANSTSIQKLYKKLLPKAQKIILREKSSFNIVSQFLKELEDFKSETKVELYHDFSLDILEIAKQQFKPKNKPTKNISMFNQFTEGLTENADKIMNFLKTGKDTEEEKQANDYILINVNSHIFNDETIKKIKTFCSKNPDTKKMFFPCDMSDDLTYFDKLKTEIPSLDLFDRTKHPLLDTLNFIYNAKSGIGARLHFLYPLKIFKIPFEAIVYKDKVRKLILED